MGRRGFLARLLGGAMLGLSMSLPVLTPEKPRVAVLTAQMMDDLVNKTLEAMGRQKFSEIINALSR